MVKTILLPLSLVAFVAACAKEPEPAPVMVDPVSVEPTYTSKL